MELKVGSSACIKFKKGGKLGSNEFGEVRRKFWEIGNARKHKVPQHGKGKPHA